MTRRQRTIVVEARADLILADEPSVQAFTAHFETQMYRGIARRALSAGYLSFARAGTIMTMLLVKLIEICLLPVGDEKVNLN
jgi:hypothetical protein